MFRKKFLQPNRIISDEGFTISFGHHSVYYIDDRGNFEFPFEDGILVPRPYQVSGEAISLSQSKIEKMVEGVANGIRFGGQTVQIFTGNGFGERSESATDQSPAIIPENEERL